MDSWSSGQKTNQEAISQLEQLLQRCQGLQQSCASLKLSAVSAPSLVGLKSIGTATKQFLDRSLILVRQGKPDRKAILEQWKNCLAISRAGQRQWFDSRALFLESLLATFPSSAKTAIGLYRWQKSMVPIWVAQSEALLSAQELLAGLDKNASKQQAESLQVMRTVLKLGHQIQSVSSANFPKCAQLAFEENVALAKVAEACVLLYDDLSSDSFARLRHCFKVLSGASTRLEGEILRSTRSLS